jgi:hypothetical protein
MYRLSSTGRLALAVALCCAAAPAFAADQHADYWAVTGVASDDVLHLRDVPSADSKSLARIPPNAHGLRNFGCRRNELPLDVWMKLSKEERRNAQTRWCRVEYRGKKGWVAWRFLKKDRGPAR